MHATTRSHLEAALAGEALAALRYHLYAERAAEEGFPGIAALFEEIGAQERREHFAEVADLLGLVDSTRGNLEQALTGEMTEHHELYPDYAGEAHRVGDEDAAERFIELGGDEHRHADLLREALRDLDALRVGVG